MRQFLANLLKPINAFLDKQALAGKLERESINTSENFKKPTEIVAEYRKKKDRRRNIFVAVGLFILVVFAINYNSTESIPNPVSEPESIVDSSWIPTSFNQYSENAELAWRWLGEKEFKCTYGDFCEGIMVIAKNGCKNSLYAEISLLDKSDVQIGFTNDSLSAALPMQESKLIFNILENEASKVRLSKISCY